MHCDHKNLYAPGVFVITCGRRVQIWFVEPDDVWYEQGMKRSAEDEHFAACNLMPYSDHYTTGEDTIYINHDRSISGQVFAVCRLDKPMNISRTVPVRRGFIDCGVAISIHINYFYDRGYSAISRERRGRTHQNLN